MSRIKILQKAQAPQEVKDLYNKLEGSGAKILNLYKTLAYNPLLLLNYLRLGNTLLTKAELPSKLRELAILRIATITGSEYEWAQHYPIALEVGVSREQANVLPNWKRSKKFSDEERAVLQYTDEVTKSVSVRDDTFKALQKYLNEREIVELTLSVGYWGLVARILVPLQVDIDVQTIASAQELTGRKKQ